MTTHCPSSKLEYSTGLCSYIFCFEQEINLKKIKKLKKSTRNVVVDFFLIAPVVRIWMCLYLAMYSTDIDVIQCCCSAQPPLFKPKATKCFLTCTCILFWKNKKEAFRYPSVSSKQQHKALCLIHTYSKYVCDLSIFYWSRLWIRWLYIDIRVPCCDW